jgi:hypothetical protein
MTITTIAPETISFSEIHAGDTITQTVLGKTMTGKAYKKIENRWGVKIWVDENDTMIAAASQSIAQLHSRIPDLPTEIALISVLWASPARKSHSPLLHWTGRVWVAEAGIFTPDELKAVILSWKRL